MKFEYNKHKNHRVIIDKNKGEYFKDYKKILKTGFAMSFSLSSSIKGNEKPVCCTFILIVPKIVKNIFVDHTASKYTISSSYSPITSKSTTPKINK